MASIMVVVPLSSIIKDKLQSSDFGLKAVAYKKIPQLLKDKYNVIFASAKQALLRHVLNYTLGVCVVKFFNSGPRRKIQMHHNF